MSEIGFFALGFCIGVALAIIFHLIAKKRSTYECDGSIIMSEDEMYLCLTSQDKAAFLNHDFAKIRLQREKFRGFSETEN